MSFEILFGPKLWLTCPIPHVTMYVYICESMCLPVYVEEWCSYYFLFLYPNAVYFLSEGECGEGRGQRNGFSVYLSESQFVFVILEEEEEASSVRSVEREFHLKSFLFS